MPTPNLRAFSEKVAIVTDAGNAFGRAVALQLALQGCYVIAGFAAESAESASALDELQALGTLASAVAADVSSDAGTTALIDAAAQTFGRLDLLVNTSLFEPNTLIVNAIDFDSAVNQTLRAAFFCAQRGAELMRNRPNASIVNLCGETTNNSLSAAIRGAIVGLTEALAADFAPRVRVNCVAWKSDKQIEAAPEFSLLRQPTAIAPDDAARAALHFLSPDAAALSGQTLFVQPKARKI